MRPSELRAALRRAHGRAIGDRLCKAVLCRAMQLVDEWKDSWLRHGNAASCSAVLPLAAVLSVCASLPLPAVLCRAWRNGDRIDEQCVLAWSCAVSERAACMASLPLQLGGELSLV